MPEAMIRTAPGVYKKVGPANERCQALGEIDYLRKERAINTITPKISTPSSTGIRPILESPISR